MSQQRFESYGVHLKLASDDEELLEEAIELARTSLLCNFHPIVTGKDDVTFELRKVGRKYLLGRNGEELTWGVIRSSFLKYFEAVVRLSVAESSPNFVFLHAGVVGWRGKGLILPANSFQGKSTLVSELVRLGAEYYSDDFALLDEKGLVHPFPRMISMRTRGKNYTQYQLDPSALGGIVGDRPIPVRMLFLTKYRSYARWNPRILSIGEGVLQTVPFTLPMNLAPGRSLKTLNHIARSAIIATGDRGEARRSARQLLNFFDLERK